MYILLKSGELNRIEEYILDRKFLLVILIVVLVFVGITIVGVSLDRETTTTEPTTESTTLPSSSEPPITGIGNYLPEETTGTIATPTNKEFTSADIGYLDDALFIGDSRTVGLQEYSDITNADFFCTVGMNVFKIYNETATVDGVSTDIKALLGSKKYGKVYIMLGINELGYNRNTAFNKYKELVDTVLSYQPDAIIFIQANIHVGAERSAKDRIINNTGINEFNTMLMSLENNQNIFYIDVNPMYDDESGNLSTTYSSDGIHLYAKYFSIWKDFILSKAIF